MLRTEGEQAQVRLGMSWSFYILDKFDQVANIKSGKESGGQGGLEVFQF